MTEAEKDAEVDRLLRLYDGMWNVEVACPMCEALFFRTPLGRVNTCKDDCQRAYNARLSELDGGRTIHQVADLTSARLAEFLGGTGLVVNAKSGKVMLS